MNICAKATYALVLGGGRFGAFYAALSLKIYLVTHLVLHVRASNGDDLQTPVTLTVVGLTQDAAVRAMPNPVSSASMVEYVVPEDAPVSVAVYAADGRLVRSLVHETATAGVYRVGFNGRSTDGTVLPAGVYYLRAVIGTDRLTQRIAVLR